jgi:dTDP-4-dehydrorhamnose reductase
MRVLVTGRSGQMAAALAERAAAWPGLHVSLLGRPELDLEQTQAVAEVILMQRPDIVINAAAYTAVDKAEAEPARAFLVNRDGAAAVANASARLGIPFIHLSTDYVFDGCKSTPYAETDDTGPINIYGSSKRDGELAVLSAHPGALILRTSWVFSPFGHNFVKTMLRLGAERDSLSIVGDQFGNPTGALDLADAILRIAPSLTGEPGGIYHYAGEGRTSWHGFAQFVFGQAARRGWPSPRLAAITTAQYPTPARRPANSCLDTTAFAQRFGFRPPSWHRATAEVVSRLLGESASTAVRNC